MSVHPTAETFHSKPQTSSPYKHDMKFCLGLGNTAQTNILRYYKVNQ